jgi:twitching motility two-component system response regulator PilH
MRAVPVERRATPFPKSVELSSPAAHPKIKFRSEGIAMTTLLVIEDDAHIRQFVAANLKIRGYEVIQAENAELGLQYLREQNPAGLLLDIKLPGMSGWDMLKQLSIDPDLPHIPVIVMTASPITNHADEQYYTYIIDKLVKPISAVDLVQAVKKMFS